MLARVGAVEWIALHWIALDGSAGGRGKGGRLGVKLAGAGMLIRIMETLSWAIMFATAPSTATATREMLRRAVMPKGNIEGVSARAAFRMAMGLGARGCGSMFLNGDNGARQHLALCRPKYRKWLAKLCTRSRAGVAAIRHIAPQASVLGFRAMELNQLKRFIKDLEERTDSLRRYL